MAIGDGKLVVAGGYGYVGTQIAKRLAARAPGRVVVAGRSRERAAAVAADCGDGSEGRRLDADDPAAVGEALGDAAILINAITDPQLRLIDAAVERGVAVVDVTGDRASYEAALGREDEARRRGSVVLIGAGHTPGTINVMVRAAKDALAGADTVRTASLMDTGEGAGRGSLEAFLKSAATPATVFENGRAKQVAPLRESIRMQFPDPVGERSAYTFTFTEPAFYPRTLGVRDVVGMLAFEPEWAGRVINTAAGLGVTGAARRKRLRELLLRLMGASGDAQPATPTEGRVALTVEVGHGSRTARIGASGTDIMRWSAAAVDLMTAAVDGGELEPGVHFPEQTIDPKPFITAMRAQGLNITEVDTGN